jgi:hypothetical protein
MIPLRAGSNSASIGGMRVVDDDGGFDETTEVRIARMRLELNA